RAAAALIDLKELPQPLHHPVPRPIDRRLHRASLPPPRLRVALEPVQDEADGGRIYWTRDDVNQSRQVKWCSEPHRSAKHALRELRHAAEDRSAARQHDARREQTFATRALDLAPHE